MGKLYPTVGHGRRQRQREHYLLAPVLRHGCFLQEESPMGAEPDTPWGTTSSRPRSSAASNLNRRTYDLEGESWHTANPLDWGKTWAEGRRVLSAPGMDVRSHGCSIPMGWLMPMSFFFSRSGRAAEPCAELPGQ